MGIKPHGSQSESVLNIKGWIFKHRCCKFTISDACVIAKGLEKDWLKVEQHRLTFYGEIEQNSS